MNRLIGVLFVSAVWVVTASAQDPGKIAPSFVIKQPTIVAFFPPFSQADLDKDQDTNEVLSDFQFYTGAVSAPLRKSGIEFQVADAFSFRIRVGTRAWTFHTGKIGVGYYFIMPGKKPQVEYGVMTDVDILDVARKYFGVAIQ